MTSPVFWVFNAGSSSIKFSVFSAEDAKKKNGRLYRGAVDGIGSRSRFTVRDTQGITVESRECSGREGNVSSHEEALSLIRDWMAASLKEYTPAAAGHRVVHGGTNYASPVWIDPAVLEYLEKRVPLAPLHQPHSLRVIRALAAQSPGLPQMACFDTAFHRTQPEVAEIFGLPPEFSKEGIRRYGFHGISYEYMTTVLPVYIEASEKRRRVVVAHLGNGASLCAVLNGKGIATTMGFTPLDGLIMGTRCGSLDPGVILHLLIQRGMKPEEVADLLYHRSGLLGVSGGISHDMRELLESPLPEAAQAVDLFVYRVVREIGSMAAALGGVDSLIFTAGIGEHSPEIRRRICEGSGWLGVRLDSQANEKGGPRISRQESPVSVWVIPTDEESMIARQMRTLWKDRPS